MIGSPPRARDLPENPMGIALADDVSYESWSAIGRHIAAVSNSSAWWVGDWLVHGERRFPGRYRRCLEELPLGYQTLRNYAWVARRVAMSRRRDDLSFQHHAEVAALDAGEQAHWLERAARDGWSRSRLRAAIRAGGQGRDDPDGPAGPPSTVRLSVADDRVPRWRDAAGLMERELADWAAQELDRAADRLLRERESGATRRQEMEATWTRM